MPRCAKRFWVDSTKDLPEFLNRIDEVIVFHTLQPSQISRIVDIQLAHMATRLEAASRLM